MPMCSSRDKQEQECLDRFLQFYGADWACDLRNVDILDYPEGKDKPPDFCFVEGQRRIAIEVLRACQENEQRNLQSRKIAEAKKASEIEKELRGRLPECHGWTIRIASLPPKREHKDFINALEQELSSLCRTGEIEKGPRVIPKSTLLRKHHVIFWKERDGPLRIDPSYSMGVDLRSVAKNVVRHLRTFNEIAARYTALVLLIDDVEGLIKGEVEEFASLIEEEIRGTKPECISSSLKILQGIYVVHWPQAMGPKAHRFLQVLLVEVDHGGGNRGDPPHLFTSGGIVRSQGPSPGPNSHWLFPCNWPLPQFSPQDKMG